MVYRIGIIVHRRFRMHKRRRCAQTARLPPVSGRSVLQFWFWSRSSGFESLFPSESAVACIPGGPSVACSTPAAIEWDASFRGNADPSGRSVRDVHHAPG